MFDDEVPSNMPTDEIANRLENYPLLSSVLNSPVLDLSELGKVARECWALGGRYDLIRFGEFINKGKSAVDAIEALIRDFPNDDKEAIKRVDSFVERAVLLGYSKPSGSADWAGAALLTSVLLTSLYPKRFADFRQSRWNGFAKRFDYDHPPSGKGQYGEKLIWAGKFTADISRTGTFRRYWPVGEPSWIISGLCWIGPKPPKPETETADSEEIRSFPEGAEKRRLHLTRERNQIVVLMAKKLGLRQDPLLRCRVCGFSFMERYGDLGVGFIEAHHTCPLSDLKPGSHTKVEDIALICPNCHRMIHRGERTLTVDELRDLLQEY